MCDYNCVMYMLDEDMFLEIICSDYVDWYIRDVERMIYIYIRSDSVHRNRVNKQGSYQRYII